MSIQQPQSTDYLNSPDHALSHRVFANDSAAPVQSINVDSSGNVGIGTTGPDTTLTLNPGKMTFQRSGTTEGYLGVEQSAGALVSTSAASDFYIRGGGPTGNILFAYGAAEAMRITNQGNVGIGLTAPTAYLHLKAGTATASTAPLKLTSGTLNTTPEAGAIEYDGTNLYFVDGTGTRRQLAVV